MRVTQLATVAALLGLLMTAALPAADEKPTATMPEMGAPKEIKEMGWLIGTWDVVMKAKFDPTAADWSEEKGTATYSYAADGAAIIMTYDSQAMGMPFKGFMLETYDRETKMWQAAWTDNMGARISFYTGKLENGALVLSGEDVWQGQKSITRISTFNQTPAKFDWKMEGSMDGGKNFVTNATAVYTKRK